MWRPIAPCFEKTMDSLHRGQWYGRGGGTCEAKKGGKDYKDGTPFLLPFPLFFFLLFFPFSFPVALFVSSLCFPVTTDTAAKTAVETKGQPRFFRPVSFVLTSWTQGQWYGRGGSTCEAKEGGKDYKDDFFFLSPFPSPLPFLFSPSICPVCFLPFPASSRDRRQDCRREV